MSDHMKPSGSKPSVERQLMLCFRGLISCEFHKTFRIECAGGRNRGADGAVVRVREVIRVAMSQSPLHSAD